MIVWFWNRWKHLFIRLWRVFTCDVIHTDRQSERERVNESRTETDTSHSMRVISSAAVFWALFEETHFICIIQRSVSRFLTIVLTCIKIAICARKKKTKQWKREKETDLLIKCIKRASNANTATNIVSKVMRLGQIFSIIPYPFHCDWKFPIWCHNFSHQQ